MALIPGRDEPKEGWEERGLESTQKNACGEKLLPVLHETHAKLNEAPCEDEERKPVANSQLTEDDVSGELEDDVGHEVQASNNAVSSANREIQSDIHPSGIGSTEVDSVNECERIDQSQNWQNADIKPKQCSPFKLRVDSGMV